ncbi:MAG: PAS domain S-box-containing protein [Sulfitobacter sp.]|jgi:PAS domain S-box-containing protein
MNPAATELRRLAEARLQGRSKPTAGLSVADTQKLLHELQVHQIELEMQNEELREARIERELALHRYTQLYEFAPIGYYVLDSGSKIIRINLQGASQLGLERSLLTGTTFFGYVAMEHQRRFRNCLAKVFETGDKQSCEILVHVGTRSLWLRVEANIGETTTDCLVAMVDVTRHKQAEKSLRTSEARYRTILQTAQDGILRLGKKGSLLEVNASYCRMSGYSEQELLTMRISDLENREAEDEAAPRFIAQHRRKDGSVFDVEVSTQYRSEQDGQFVIFVQDISERKELESQLRQSQKMESLGTLAGGIAHEFNNFLAVILGHTEISMMTLPANSKVKQNLQSIYKSATRAAVLVSQILIFSRRKALNVQILNLSQVVNDALELVTASVPSNIEIRQDLLKECPAIKADNTQIHQIILNLCSNALHAMELSGGVLRVSVEDWKHCPPHLGLGDGGYLELKVQDSGQGISEADLEHIFDPFFTTKQVGKGTGLGLSVVLGIVEKHQGKMTVESQPGEGTTFSIYLPTIEALVPKMQVTEAAAQKGQGHILIVDDQPELIYLYQTCLEKQGYKVSACSNGDDALALFESRHELFDLVLTDQSMPGMTGMQLVPKLLAIRPDIPILLSTGYNELMTEETNEELGIRACLKKPISLKLLQKSISENLG